MIKLTLNPQTSSPETALFMKEKVTIGRQADLSLPSEDLQNVHVQIQELDGRFVIINVANDPFATLNGDPFGKRSIQSQDYLQIGKTQILFEGTLSTAAPVVSPTELYDTEHGLVDILDKAIENNKIEAVAKKQKYDWRAELEKEDDPSPHLTEEEAEDLAVLEEIAKEADILSPKESSPFPFLQEEEEDEEEEEASKEKELASTEPRNKLTLKDYYLHEFDDELENWTREDTETEAPAAPNPKKWRTILAFLIGILILIAILAEGYYLTVSGKSNKEELQASEAVADIAMALAYAQHYHVKPVNQNWSDPEFLKANLTNILSDKHSTLATIDTHGKFTTCPYILRVYTSGDMSQFVVLAQPVPSLHHWLVPKATIIVDSKAMEMRKITDLKALNRLLFVPNTLDGSNAFEISALIKKGELIPLSRLTHKNNRMSFSPPKALAFLRPGAENYIYNAPRYYPFAENLLAKALKVSQYPDNSHDLNLLHQEIDAISRFPDLVLYSSEGLQTALKEQRALNMISPNKKFLVAYMRFNDNGNLKNSHLLIDQDSGEVALNAPPPRDENKMPSNASENDALQEVPKKALPPKKLKNDIDYSHPLYIQLYALLSNRHQALKPLADEMISLLLQESAEITAEFQPRFDSLVKEYEGVDSEQQTRMVRSIIELYKNHSEMPVAHFIAYIRAAGLGTLAKQPLKDQAILLGDRILQKEQLDGYLQNIRNAEHFQDLEQYVREAANALTLENLPEPEKLMLWQNELRTQVQHKVGEFLFSPQKALSNDTLNEGTRTQLSNILKMAWVTDQGEYQFFLTEYDLLSKPAALKHRKPWQNHPKID